MEPASVRTKNPGAMWGSALAIKWGANKKAVVLNDGLGQGNNIAVFPNFVQGICAQLDLWRSSPLYKDKAFEDAIGIWCGHNNTEAYISFVLKKVPGMTRRTVMDDAFWNGPLCIPFLQAQAAHEAGMFYPAPQEDWIEAQHRVLGMAKPSSSVLSFVKPEPLLKSKIMRGAMTTASSIGTAAVAKVAENANTHTTVISVSDVGDAIQRAKDTMTTVSVASDNVTAIVQMAKPFLGVAANTWAGVAVIAMGIAIVAIGYTMWQRWAKLRDQGV